LAGAAAGVANDPDGRENGPDSRDTVGVDPDAKAGRAGNDGRGGGAVGGTALGGAAGRTGDEIGVGIAGLAGGAPVAAGVDVVGG
jgi:hypothetical protein